MQINSKFVALGLTTVMFAATAYAMAPGDHEWFERFDTDRNGQFSPAEIDSALSQMFARADSNRDGRLTLDEARAFHGAHSDHPGPGRLDGDANRDGFLTLAEFQARARDHLTRADADHDGQLSMSEVEAMHGEAHGHR